MPALPKPVKRRTVKTQRRRAKAANIRDVREDVFVREGHVCRIAGLLRAFGFGPLYGDLSSLELAHLRGRGMGGNPDRSRDTRRNTVAVQAHLHTGIRSLHSGHLKIRPLTSQGADGPCCIEFYERLPTELGKS